MPIRRTRTLPSSRGFTLAEVLVAIVIFGLVIIAVSSVMRTAVRSWNTGHDMDEIVQTARVTRDMLDRDFGNLVYLSQRDYNQNFERSLVNAGRLYQDDYTKNQGAIMLDDRFDFSKLTPPIDLSFRAGGSGEDGSVSFVRSHTPRFPGDPNTWGLRRITYYVEKKTLFRREDDPFGFRPGELDESFYNPGDSAAAALATQFMKQGGDDFLKAGGGIPDIPAEGDSLLPQPYQAAEPLCEGVETFDVTCGYFKGGEWQETQSWDSSARQFRRPPKLGPADDPDANKPPRDLNNRLNGLPGAGFLPPPQPLGNSVVMINGQPTLIEDRGQPDDLPGYIVIQIGVRGPRGVGKIHKFTFFHSLPMAQETDIIEMSPEDQAAGFRPDVDLNPPSDKRL